jgi:predicted phage-related endonuclease
MKKEIIRIPTLSMSRDEWLIERNKGIGGSDIGSIMGVDKYKPALRLFHEKIGFWSSNHDNIAAYAGRVWEDGIYEFFWKYWYPGATKEQVMSLEYDGSKELMLQNANAETPVRKARNVNAMIINPEYPWIRVNLDREICKYKDMPNGILELKKPKSMHWNSYEAGIPPGYIFQVQSQLMATGYDWGELFAVLDGVEPKMFRFEKNETLQNAIKEKTYQFWQNVLEGRKIVEDKSLTHEQKVSALAEFEPEPESSEAYEVYMKDRYKSDAKDAQCLSTKEVEQWREDYWRFHEAIKEAEKGKKLASNSIRNYARENSSNVILLEDKKEITLFKSIKVPKPTNNG